VTTAQLKETIANAAMRRKAPTALDQFFADNLVIVAPAEFRDDYRSLIAYVSGSEYCGSGGCNGYVLEQRADGPGYRVVTKIVPARLPISVLPAIHNGRHDIGVIVAGGGIIHSYVGALSYDGKSYASNPTLSNIPHVKKGVGKIVLGPPGASPSQCRLR
jgi:hypothetical protein